MLPRGSGHWCCKTHLRVTVLVWADWGSHPGRTADHSGNGSRGEPWLAEWSCASRPGRECRPRLAGTALSTASGSLLPSPCLADVPKATWSSPPLKVQKRGSYPSFYIPYPTFTAVLGRHTHTQHLFSNFWLVTVSLNYPLPWRGCVGMSGGCVWNGEALGAPHSIACSCEGLGASELG